MIGMVVVLSLIIYGIIESLYLMSIATFLFAGVYILMENNSLPVLSVQVDASGIRVGESMYDYWSLDKFALISVWGIPSFLRLSLKKRIGSSIDIPLSSDVNPQILKEFLLGYLEEDTTAKFSNSDALIHVMRL